MVLSWYLINFCPKDLFAQIFFKLPFLTFIFGLAQDFLRLHLCLLGVESVPQGQFVYKVLVGVAKSSGFMVLKYLEHALDKHDLKPFKVPNFPTKTCVLASMAFASQSCGFYDFGGHQNVLAGLTLVAVSLRLFCSQDPYLWTENLTCNIVFGSALKASKKVNLDFFLEHLFLKENHLF